MTIKSLQYLGYILSENHEANTNVLSNPDVFVGCCMNRGNMSSSM